MPVAFLAVLLSSAAPVCAMTNTADNPAPRYWFRTGRAVPAEAQPMDPRLREVGDAFGAGDCQRTRDLAQALLDATDDAPLCTEAAAFIIESHLAEGDFDRARAALQDLSMISSAAYQEGLSRIQRAEALHAACATRLQHIIASCLQPGAVARARRELARIRLCAGEGHAAFEYYYQLIAQRPASLEAEQAVRAVAGVILDCLGPEAAESILTHLKQQYSNTRTSAMAAYELALLAAGEKLTASGAESFLAVIAQSPGSQGASLASSYLRERGPELVRSLEQLRSWGRHQEVVAHFGRLAPYLDSLDQAAFTHAVNTVVASGGHFSLAEEVKPTIRALLASPGCRNDPGKSALLYHAEGVLALQTGDSDAAVHAWRCLLEDHPASKYAAQATLQLGDHYVAAGKPEEAIRAYTCARRAVQHLSPEDRASAMVGAGRALEDLGRYAEAAYEYRAAIGLAAHSAAAYQAAQALEWLESPP